MSARHAAITLAGLGVAVSMASCGDPTPPAAASAQASAPVAATPVKPRSPEPARAVPEPKDLPKLFGERQAPRDDWEAENVRRNDPAYDGWPTEVAAARIEAQLAECLPALWNAQDLAPFLAADFAGATELRPAKLDTVFDDGHTRVLRAKTIDGELHAELAPLLSELRRPFGDAPVRTRSDLILVDIGAGNTFDTIVCVEASGAPKGAPVQQNARWRVAWIESDEHAAPRMRSIRVESFEEVHAREFFFADQTGRVFGANAHFDREFRLGIGDYYFKNDQLTANEFLGGQGVAVGDVDGDGLEDLYVSMQGGLPNRLFLHRDDGTAIEAPLETKVAFVDGSGSALLVDLDDDGDQDMFVALGANVVVAYNDGHGVFDDQVLLKGPSPEDIFSLAAADADRDGDIDLFCCRYGREAMIGALPTPYCDAHNGAPDIYWRNDGERRFKDATKEAGFDEGNDRYGLAAVWEDFDDDGDPDLYVANDFGRNNLWRNDGGHFRDVAGEVGADDMAAGMGATTADFDLDGDFDLYVSNMFSAPGLRTTRIGDKFMGGEHRELHKNYVGHARGNSLLRNRGDGRFEDVSESFGVTRAGWSWGAKFVDFGGDGYADLFVPNGFVTADDTRDVSSFFWRRVISQSPPAPPIPDNYRQAWSSIQRMVMNDGMTWAGRERNRAFLNLRGGSFADVSACSGLDFADDSRAAAVVDWDEDGQLDLVFKNRNAPRIRFVRNQSSASAHWLECELVGAKRNRDAIGARVVVELDGRTLRESVRAGEGYLAQSSKRLHFGLGDAERAKRVSVRWPDGSTQSFDDLAADKRYRLVQGESRPTAVAPRKVETFAHAAPTPVERLPGGVRRVPLVERLPVSELPLPSFDGAARKVADLRGKLVLITLWASSSPPSVDEIAELGRRRAEFEALGLELAPLSIDEGPQLLAARKLIAQHGLERGAGYADGHMRQLLEVLLITLLGRSSDVPVPTSLLIDQNGEWVVAYLGPLDFGALRDDVELIQALGARRRTDRLFGGRWVVHPTRDLSVTADVFKTIGANEMAALCRARSGDAKEMTHEQ